MSNLDTILSFLRSKGLSAAQAAGVAGNLQVESGFDPSAYNPREGAIGIAQWEGGRRTALDSYAAATGGKETDLNTQLGFMWSELTGSESGALQHLQAASTPAQAAAAWDQYYERSAGTSRATREQDAQNIAAGNLPGPLGSLGSSPYTGGSGGQVGGYASGSANAASQSRLAAWWSQFTSTWAGDAMKLALYGIGGAASAGLVIVGAVHTVSDK